MKHFAKREDMMITTADKVGAVVIMDTENYINKANRQLSDKSNSKIFQTDPTLQHNKMVNDTFGRFKNKNLISKKNCRRTENNKSTDTKIYITPKKHKENDPRRSAINAINCHTSEISGFLDHHLQPIVKEIPSYIKDTNDFVDKINKFKFPENSFLVTRDVKALYTNIPNKEAIAAVKRKHGNYTNKTVATKVTTTFNF